MIKIKGVAAMMLKLKVQLEIEEQKNLKAEQEKLLIKLKEATPVDTGEAREGWHITKHSIENEVPHIQLLNQGTSKQAPAYFIEQTIIDSPNIKVKGVIVRDK